MKSKRFFLFCCSGFFLLFVCVHAQCTDKIINNPRKVVILTPKNTSVFDWDSFIRYSIRVTDAEDGNSDYDEISLKEVFLEVTYLPGNSKPNEGNLIKAGMVSDPPDWY